MKKQQGFTLIELVAVIVLLGILAVTAVPRFLDLQGNARDAVVNGVRAGVQGAMSQVYAKSLIEGTEALSSSSVPGPAGGISTVFGYPEATIVALRAAMELDEAGQIELVEATTTINGNTVPVVHIGFDRQNNNDIEAGNCYFTYTEAQSATSSASTSTVTFSGC